MSRVKDNQFSKDQLTSIFSKISKEPLIIGEAKGDELRSVIEAMCNSKPGSYISIAADIEYASNRRTRDK